MPMLSTFGGGSARGFGFGAASGGDGPIVTDSLIWHFDAANSSSYSGSGSTWYDLIGSENGTLVSSPTYSTAGSEGGGAFFFDGSNDYVTTNFSRTNGAYSFAAWYKPSVQNANGNHWIANTFESSSAEWWGIGLADGNVVGRPDWTIDNDAGKVEISASATTSVWQMITGTRSGNTMKLYVNATLAVTSTSLTTTTITGVEPIWIASRSNVGSGPSEMYTGWLSDLKMYSKELSASEVLLNYDALKGRYEL